jgi:hypothetical protein
MSTLSPNLGLTYLIQGQAGGAPTANSDFNLIESFCQGSVKSRTTVAQPGSPANGDRYLLTGSPTGAQWTGNANKLAFYYSGWKFITAKEGFRFWVDDENKFIIYNGTTWTEMVVDASSAILPHRRRVDRLSIVQGTAGTWYAAGGGSVAINGAGNSNADDADGPFIRIDTGTTSGDEAYVKLTADYKRDWLSDLIAYIKTPPTITSLRMFVGFFSAIPTNTDNPSGHYAAFRYSTVAGDAGWRFMTKDNSTQSIVTGSSTFTADTPYVLRVKMLASSIEAYINDALVFTASSNLPGASTLMAPTHHIFTQTAAARILKHSSFFILTD